MHNNLSLPRHTEAVVDEQSNVALLCDGCRLSDRIDDAVRVPAGVSWCRAVHAGARWGRQIHENRVACQRCCNRRNIRTELGEMMVL